MFWIQKNPAKGALAALGAGLLSTYHPAFDGKNMGISTEPTENEMEYVKHLATHGISLNTKEEHEQRFQEFTKKHQMIKDHNASGKSWKLGHNHMSTWTDAEFQATLGYKHTDMSNANVIPEATSRRLQSMTYDASDYIADTAAATVDWRSQGRVASVKNQGQCGSCWTFSTAGAVTGAMVAAGHPLNSFSEQMLVDCSHTSPNNGCGGGNPVSAMSWINQGNLLVLDSDYPYVSSNGVATTCSTTMSANGIGSVSNLYGYTSGTDTTGADLMSVIDNGPASILVEATQASFQMYQSGIIDADCGDNLDHAVLAVGYGGSGADSYIIVKNSWGPDWGESGYLKVHPSQCGIYKFAVRPTSN